MAGDVVNDAISRGPDCEGETIGEGDQPIARASVVRDVRQVVRGVLKTA